MGNYDLYTDYSDIRFENALQSDIKSRVQCNYSYNNRYCILKN